MPTQKKYNPITEEIARKIKNICGDKFVIFYDKEKLKDYSHDEIPEKKYSVSPELVVKPSNTSEISKILKIANQNHIPITPRGAGSGLSGGAVPIYGGIVIHFERMNKILELDTENMTITVEPGVISNDINEYIKDYNLFYAGYPMSLETCFIGGNVAENAGGGKAIKYGVTSRYVIGLEVVSPTGNIISYGGKIIKDVSGYNMIQLMLGSEGTLGIFTKITLKLIPLPKHQVDLLCLFKTSEQAIKNISKIITNSGITPTSIEYMDKKSAKTSCEYINESIDYKKAGAMLLISLDGVNKAPTEWEYEITCEYLEKCEGLIEIYVGDNPLTSERIWNIRKNIGEAYNLISSRQSCEDIVVPPASIPNMVKKLESLSEKYDIIVPCFGHAGDGNLHARIVCPKNWTNTKWNKTLPSILKELYNYTNHLGGKLSGEHGIGHKRKNYLNYVTSEEYIQILKSIKQVLDPNYILNPGKIFD